MRDPRVIALGLVLLGNQIGLYGVQLWLPQIVQGMGFSNFATGFVVALCFIAGMIAMILWARRSDAKGERIWHVAIPLCSALWSCSGGGGAIQCAGLAVACARAGRDACL